MLVVNLLTAPYLLLSLPIPLRQINPINCKLYLKPAPVPRSATPLFAGLRRVMREPRPPHPLLNRQISTLLSIPK
jgi:hypothetical protein